MDTTNKYKILEKHFPNILTGFDNLIQKIQNNKNNLNFKLSKNNIKQIIKAKELTELKILELWEQQNDPLFKQLCTIYFELYLVLENNLQTENDIYEFVKTLFIGYLGEDINIVKNYLVTEKDKIWSIDTPEDWNKRLFVQSIKALVNLLIEESPQDIKKSTEIIDNLRKEQAIFETDYLNKIDIKNFGFKVSEIVSLYYFAKIIDVLGQYLLQDHSNVQKLNNNIESEIEYLIKTAKIFANTSNNIILAHLYQYLESFSKKFIKNNTNKT